MTKKQSSNIGVYPGTFDPLTLGHLDVIIAGSKIFDTLVIAIGNNREKICAFDVAERVALIRGATQHLKNIEIGVFEGLVVDFALERGAGVLLRGLRTEADYTYEMQMAMMNKNLAGQIQTIFVPTRQDYSHISSSLVKEVSKLGGDVSKLVPAIVDEALQAKFKK